jgi:hypothetical protein
MLRRTEAGLLNRAKPITLEGKIEVDPANLTARHDAHEKTALGFAPGGRSSSPGGSSVPTH